MNNGTLTHIDLFSGIGGFALPADWILPSIRHVFCDNEPFRQEVLRQHWPDAPIYCDVRTLAAGSSFERFVYQPSRPLAARDDRQALRRLPGGGRLSATQNASFLLTGGFPCQPFSQAGRRRGTADDRYLWPHMLECVATFRSQWVIAENVGGLVTKDWFSRQCALTWKRRDTKFSRTLFQLAPLARRTAATVSGSSLIPKTPSASDGQGGIMEIRKSAAGKYKLRDIVPHYTAKRGFGTGLKLQPVFVEWMMGFPQGWTEISDSRLSEIRSSRRSRP
jgi:hypothetical protein